MAIEEAVDPGIPEWVVTFGDMMSLLLTFFIMLVSMSEMKEEEKFQAMVESMRRQFGPSASNAAIVPGEMRPRNSDMTHIATQGRAQRKNTMRGGDKVQAPVGENQRVASIRRGKISAVGGSLLFDSFSTKLTEDSKRKLDQIAQEVRGKRHVLEVKGHTLLQPAPAEYAMDNEDLSFQRARAVKKYLVAKGITSDRIQLSALGSGEPIYKGHNPDEQKKNARVEVFMSDKQVR